MQKAAQKPSFPSYLQSTCFHDTLGFQTPGKKVCGPPQYTIQTPNLRRYDWKTRDNEAVHYAPHGYLDVKNIACDFLACSPYKFFGPHSGLVGHLWGMDGFFGPGFRSHLLNF